MNKKQLFRMVSAHAKYVQTQCGKEMHVSNVDLRNADFRGVNLEGASFYRSNLAGADFRGAKLDNASFYGSDMAKAKFGGASLHSANLKNTNLRGADFRKATLFQADMDDADLSEAKFAFADLRRARLRMATCLVTNFAYANMAYAYLFGADLRSAQLTEADLTGADMREVNLVGAHLANANLRLAGLIALSLPMWRVFVHVNTLRIGEWHHTHEEWMSFTNSKRKSLAPAFPAWWTAHKAIIAGTIKVVRAQACEGTRLLIPRQPHRQLADMPAAVKRQAAQLQEQN